MASRFKQEHADDDIISRCGSISGETFASRRSKQAGCSLRQHSVDLIAKKLREYPFEEQDQSGNSRNNGCKQSHNNKPRFNKIFHHYRFLVAMFGGFSVGVMFLLRYNITISILKMVNQTHLFLEEHPDKTVEDMIAAGHTIGGDFNWNNEIQHMIMSWYMVAYTLPQIPSTKLASIIGVRWSIPISLSICAISTIFTPFCAYLGWEYVIFLRLINGLGASAILPMLLTLVEDWMRFDEISLGLSLAQGLTSLLAATNPLIAGYLSSIHWSYSFYIPGFATLVFCALWAIMITDNPVDNYFISEEELRHICECDQIDQAKQSVVANNNKNNSNGGKQLDVVEDDGMDYKPNSWVQILRVPSFYAYILIWCCYCSSYSGFSFILPTYLRQFLKIKIAQNGLYCFIVQFGCIFAVMWPHPLLRLLEQKFKFSVTASRRIAHLVCCSMVSATWLYVGWFHESQLLMLFLNRCFQSGNDIIVTGCLMSNYAKAGISSLVFSMVNTIGNLSVVFSSTFIGWLLDYTAQSRQGWCMIFSGLGIGQLVMWLIFATVVRAGPIRFNNNRLKNDRESKLQRSVSSQFEQPASQQQQQQHHQQIKSTDGPIFNNFDKLKGATSQPEDLAANEKSQESRQI